MVRSYGPARMPKERMMPFQGGGPPPAPGGATSPMPVQERPKISRERCRFAESIFLDIDDQTCQSLQSSRRNLEE